MSQYRNYMLKESSYSAKIFKPSESMKLSDINNTERRFLLEYTLKELLVSAAALMEHHSKKLLDFTERKDELALEQKASAAAYIKICEQLVGRIYECITEAEMMGWGSRK